jgi:hypothetical protein
LSHADFLFRKCQDNVIDCVFGQVSVGADALCVVVAALQVMRQHGLGHSLNRKPGFKKLLLFVQISVISCVSLSCSLFIYLFFMMMG